MINSTLQKDMMNYDAFFSQSLEDLKLEGRYRVFANLERQSGQFPYAWDHQAQKRVNVWCSNDYLAMGQNPGVLAAMEKTLKTMGAGAGGTRNISGNTYLHRQLEAEIADFHGKEAALIFSSGYVANETTLETLSRHLPNCVVFSDAHNHASIIQGIRNSRVEKRIFKHNDPQDLERHLQSVPPNCAKIIVFESIYSMEGDIAPIAAFCDIAERYNALTYIDEVHGVGLYGDQGAGVAEAQNLSNRLSIIQAGLGKACGIMGGYIAGSRNIIDFVRSHSPGFIFTTALPPVVVAGLLESLRFIRNASQEREHLQSRAVRLKAKLKEAGLPVMPSQTHIVPVLVGEAQRCKVLTERLRDEYAIYVQPINYPTVPQGTERLRLTPTCVHTDEMIEELVSALKAIWTVEAVRGESAVSACAA